MRARSLICLLPLLAIGCVSSHRAVHVVNDTGHSVASVDVQIQGNGGIGGGCTDLAPGSWFEVQGDGPAEPSQVRLMVRWQADQPVVEFVVALRPGAAAERVLHLTPAHAVVEAN
jgi:hypothetical protein